MGRERGEGRRRVASQQQELLWMVRLGFVGSNWWCRSSMIGSNAGIEVGVVDAGVGEVDCA